MYNVIKFTDKDGNVNHIPACEDMCSGGITSHPGLVAIEISNLDDAIELANYFDREINDIWDKLKKPPFYYKEPRSNNIPLHVQFEEMKSNPITQSANSEHLDY